MNRVYSQVFKGPLSPFYPDEKNEFQSGSNSQTYPTLDGTKVIKIIDFEKSDFNSDKLYGFIVMGRISDPRFAETITEKKEVVQAYERLCDAGIYHGDQNKGNVLLDGNNKVYIIDLDGSFHTKNVVGCKCASQKKITGRYRRRKDCKAPLKALRKQERDRPMLSFRENVLNEATMQRDAASLGFFSTCIRCWVYRGRESSLYSSFQEFH